MHRGGRSAAIIAISVSAIWWFGLFVTGFPRPHFDDIFFVGTAQNLAAGHGLANPYIARWTAQFGTQSFFGQPPFHSYLLAGWIELFGSGTNPLRAFNIACCFATNLLLIALCRRANLGWLNALAVGLLVSTALLRTGLRPDAAGMLATCAAAYGWSGTSRISWFIGCVCGAAAPCIHPFTAAFVVPLGIWFLANRAAGQPVPAKQAGVLGGMALLATFCVFGIFLAAIEGRIGEFMQVFRQHAGLREVAGGRQWSVLFEKLTFGREPWLRWPTVGVFVLTGALAYRMPTARARVLSVVSVFGLFIVCGTLLYTNYVPSLLYLFALVGAAFMAATLPGRHRVAIGAIWVVALGLMSFPGGYWALFGRQFSIDAAPLRARLSAYETEGRRLLIDEYAARYVYDWRLPAGAQDWLHCHWDPFLPYRPPKVAEKPSDEVWVIEASKLEMYVPDSAIINERVTLFGHKSSLFRDRGDIRIIP